MFTYPICHFSGEADIWDISSASYDSKSFAFGTQDAAIGAIWFKPDGTKMYVLGVNTDKVYQYGMTTAWDVSTASYDSKSVSVGVAGFGLAFSADGTKFYMCDLGADRVYQYGMTTAWDVSTASSSGKSVLVSGQDGLPRDVFFKPDGTTMYLTGDINNTIYQYTLSTPWDISTASYASKSKSVNAETSGTTGGVYLSPDGDKMWTGFNTTDTVYQYTLSTPWDISTASYDSVSAGVSSQVAFGSGVVFKETTGDKMYVTDYNTTFTVYQYSL